MVLHTLEGDEAGAWGFYHFPEYLEAISLSQPVFADFVLDKPLGAFFQGLLDFTNADAAKATVAKAVLD